ncbi:hypothetical protein FUA26_00600 [Seonamhaeicola algicola]|uniref:Uncharacterized protein n=1 Tax=Seonamhaeicola algicola TaxID=1719036 RepID=A0A5C7B2U2_9FLAO|nr:hypothetical protein [Seonamhaeicola algicola]TXE15041.1 hypothetical protein FUA26_00600 [Seonamhaeicola algicola]
MNYKLQNTPNYDLETLKKDVDSGAKFVLFNYRIGLGLFSLLRFSPAIFVRREKDIQKFKKKYNVLNVILGPWFIFKGPFLTYNAYKVNKSGGIDVTKDVLANLTEEQLKNKEVNIKIIHNIFQKVNKLDKKSITKAIRKTNLNLVPIKNTYVALFINVDEYKKPYYVIGIELYKQIEIDKKHIKTNLNQYFYKHVEFKIFNINEDIDYANKLIEQGDSI